MTRLNKEQLQAVNTLGQNVVVSASAGAGKTAVLIERLMKRILVDKVSITEITALTFTEAAANEMKVRLLKSLNKAYQTSQDKNDRNYINQQITLVETANITTLHAYGLTIIKNYGYILGIDPARSQNILDPAVADLYKEQALEKTLDKWFSEHPTESQQLLDAFVRNPINLDPLKKAIRTTAGFLLTKANRNQAIESTLNSYLSNDFESLPSHILEGVFQPFELHMSIISSVFEEFINDAITLLPHTKHAEHLETHYETDRKLNKILEKIKTRDISFYQDIPDVLNIEIKSIRKSKDDANGLNEMIDIYQASSNRLSDAINVALKYYMPFDKVFNTLNQQVPLMTSLFDIATDYLDFYEKVKAKANGFDFDDFEVYALAILNHNDGHIAKIIRNKTTEILVDEYQDTNEIQDAMIQRISNGNNVFRVGDLKQSIYRFRGAKPTLMQNLMRKENVDTIYFMHNYRSKKNIVAYNNLLFESIMMHTVSDSYSKKDIVEAGNLSATQNNHPVELHMIENDQEARLLKEDENKIVATAIANRIITLHKEENIPFKDFTILTRNHANKIPLKEAFEQANIPHFIDDRSGFFKSNFISKITHWLNYLINPHDYHLVEVLTSPFFNLTYGDIVHLKLDYPVLIEGVHAQYPKVYNIISETQKRWKTLDIVSVLSEMININNVYHNSLSIQVKSNVDFLLEKAIGFQSSNNPTLQGFIDYIRNLDDDKNPESTPLSDEDDVVRVATIHQSKGLQYPVTIVWPLGSRQVQDFKDPVLTDETFGVLVNDFEGPYHQQRKNLLRLMAEFKQEQEDLEEYIRLLYVAFTRAENRLIIIDAVNELPSDNEVSQYLLQNFKRATDLIYPVDGLAYLARYHAATSDIKPMILSDPIKETTPIGIFKTPFESTAVQVELRQEDDFEFMFNENFIYGVSYGNILHEAIETLPHRTWHDEDLSPYSESIQMILKKYNRHPLTKKIYSYDSIEHEMPFVYMEDDEPKQGIIDFYAINNQEIILVDFKSDNVGVDTLLIRYKAQIDLYKKALETTYPGLKCHAYIYSFNLNDYIPCTD